MSSTRVYESHVHEACDMSCKRTRARNTHDTITHGKEFLCGQRLGEEISDVLICRDVWYLYDERLNHVTDEEMTTLDVFHFGMVFRVVTKQ